MDSKFCLSLSTPILPSSHFLCSLSLPSQSWQTWPYAWSLHSRFFSLSFSLVSSVSRANHARIVRVAFTHLFRISLSFSLSHFPLCRAKTNCIISFTLLSVTNGLPIYYLFRNLCICNDDELASGRDHARCEKDKLRRAYWKENTRGIQRYANNASVRRLKDKAQWLAWVWEWKACGRGFGETEAIFFSFLFFSFLFFLSLSLSFRVEIALYKSN